MGNEVGAAVSLHTWFSILVKRPFVQGTQNLERSIQSLLKAAAREISCGKEQSSIHAGRAGRSAGCAWIRCSWDPNTAVRELYQEDTTIELLPEFSTCRENKIRLTKPSPISEGEEEKHFWMKVKLSNAPFILTGTVYSFTFGPYLLSQICLVITSSPPTPALLFLIPFCFPFPLCICRLRLLLYTPTPWGSISASCIPYLTGLLFFFLTTILGRWVPAQLGIHMSTAGSHENCRAESLLHLCFILF